MNRFFCLLLPCALLLAACAETHRPGLPNIIFDTDIGNDIDDAEALDLLYKYQEEGSINLIGICINKKGEESFRFVDLMGIWYGHPDIPVGITHTEDSTGCAAADCYTGAVCAMKAGDGSPLFVTSGKDSNGVPEACRLYRKLLSEAEDNSVTIVSVGFFNNLSLLMDSGADEFSSLCGMELIKRKVKTLCIMAGRFFDERPEYNVVVDIPASKRVLEGWPTSMVIDPWELGMMVRYPSGSIENDFDWGVPHPLKEAYIRYHSMPYDNVMFDPIAATYASGHTEFFTLGEPGSVSVDSLGVTGFHPEEDGQARIMYMSEKQASSLLEHFREYLTRKPERFQI